MTFFSVEKIAEMWNPFRETVWVALKSPIQHWEILQAINEDRTLSFEVEKPMEMDFWDISTRKEHIERIAWFVKNYDENKAQLEIDFGIPGTTAFFQMLDGNHRLAAALYLDKKWIRVEWSGSEQYAQEFAYLQN